MPTGIVKWFNNAKGFGFIVGEHTQEDIFAHYSAIEMDGFRTLKTGQTVEYELEKGNKGFHAVNIRAQATAAQVNANQTQATQAQLNTTQAPNSIDETEHA